MCSGIPSAFSRLASSCDEAAFASQVQPIGDTRYSPDLITVRRHTKKAARIKLVQRARAKRLLAEVEPQGEKSDG